MIRPNLIVKVNTFISFSVTMQLMKMPTATVLLINRGSSTPQTMYFGKLVSTSSVIHLVVIKIVINEMIPYLWSTKGNLMTNSQFNCACVHVVEGLVSNNRCHVKWVGLQYTHLEVTHCFTLENIV